MINCNASKIYHQDIYQVDKPLSNNCMEQKEIWRENLRALAARCKTKKEAAEMLNMEPARLNHMIGPKPIRNVTADTARLAEDVFGYPRYWMDTPHPTDADSSPVATSPAQQMGCVDAGCPPEPPHERDYALIPQYHVSGECGSGYLNSHEEVKGGLAFKRDWLARMSLKAGNLSVIYACGQSMAPTINEGEVLLVDHNQQEPRDGQVFAIEREGELLIKRLARHPAGGWICRSDNPDKIRYADWEPVSAEQLGLLRIVGRIVWRGGAM